LLNHSGSLAGVKTHHQIQSLQNQGKKIVKDPKVINYFWSLIPKFKESKTECEGGVYWEEKIPLDVAFDFLINEKEFDCPVLHKDFNFWSRSFSFSA